MKLTRDEMIDLVRQIRIGAGTDEEVSDWIAQIKRSVSHPQVLNVITRSKEGMDAEDIVDQLLDFQPLSLGPSTE